MRCRVSREQNPSPAGTGTGPGPGGTRPKREQEAAGTESPGCSSEDWTMPRLAFRFPVLQPPPQFYLRPFIIVYPSTDSLAQAVSLSLSLPPSFSPFCSRFLPLWYSARAPSFFWILSHCHRGVYRNTSLTPSLSFPSRFAPLGKRGSCCWYRALVFLCECDRSPWRTERVILFPLRTLAAQVVARCVRSSGKCEVGLGFIHPLWFFLYRWGVFEGVADL